MLQWSYNTPFRFPSNTESQRTFTVDEIIRAVKQFQCYEGAGIFTDVDDNEKKFKLPGAKMGCATMSEGSTTTSVITVPVRN